MILVFVTKNNKNELVYNSPEPFGTNSSVFSIQDSDEDGVPDWEEILWGTDPFNPDTGGTGIGDKNKIEQLKAGVSLQNKADSKIKSEKKPETLTETVGKELLAEFLKLKQEKRLDDGSTQNLVDWVIKRGIGSTPSNYSTRDLLISDEKTTPQVLASYANVFFGTISAYSLELEKIERSSEHIFNPDSPLFQKVVPSASKIYSNMVRDLKKIRVPKELLQQHLAIINSYDGTSKDFLLLLESKKDPLATIGAMIRISERENYRNAVFKQVVNYLSSSGIILSETGGFLTN